MTTRLLTVNVLEEERYWPTSPGFRATDVGPTFEASETDRFLGIEDLEAIFKGAGGGSFVVNGAIGEVQMWGNLSRSEDGCWSDYSYPQRILLPDHWWGWYGQTVDKAARELEAYGVPVEVIGIGDRPAHVREHQRCVRYPEQKPPILVTPPRDYCLYEDDL